MLTDQGVLDAKTKLFRFQDTQVMLICEYSHSGFDGILIETSSMDDRMEAQTLPKWHLLSKPIHNVCELFVEGIRLKEFL